MRLVRGFHDYEADQQGFFTKLPKVYLGLFRVEKISFRSKSARLKQRLLLKPRMDRTTRSKPSHSSLSVLPIMWNHASNRLSENWLGLVIPGQPGASASDSLAPSALAVTIFPA